MHLPRSIELLFIAGTIGVLFTSVAAAQKAEPSAPTQVQPSQGATKDATPAWGLSIGSTWWQPSAEIRPRLEVRPLPYVNGQNPKETTHFVTSRVRFGLEGRLDPVRLFVQIQDVRDFGATGTTDVGGAFTGLHQGYLELNDADHGWVRVGRQEVSYGKQRMIGALNWASQARAFDAVRLHGIFGKLQVDTMGAYLRSQGVLTTGEEVEGDFLATLYLTYTAGDWLKLEPYVLYRHDDAIEGDPSRKRNIAAPGVRASGTIEAFDYDVELVAQGGKTHIAGVNDTHVAFAAATEVGYALGGTWKPALRAGGAYATGQSTNGKVDEFDNFFPTNHMHYGAADLFGWRNLIWGFLRAGVAPKGSSAKATLTGHLFALANPAARWSNAGGATLGVNPANQDRFLGAEFDLNGQWTPVAHLVLSGGYSIFIPAQGAKNLGNPDPTHWLYVMADVKLP